MQTVQTGTLPFTANRETIHVAEGLTIEEMVNVVIPRQVNGLDIVVNVNDQIIPKEKWASVKPKVSAIVGINIVPAGGKGGKKNPLVTILSIVVAIAAPYAAGAILGPGIIASTAAGAAAISGAVRIGISMIGYLALSMLSSTPKQRSSVAESQTQFIEGASNAINKFGVIPINLGVNRMFPPQAALPFTETVGNDQYVRQLFTYGYGKVLVTERKFGETLLSEYNEVELEDKFNADLSSGVALYSTDVYQEGLEVDVTFAAGYILRTTQNDVDEASVDLTFARGLVAYSEKGNKFGAQVNFTIEYAPTGTSSWSNSVAGLSVSAQNVAIPIPVRDGRNIVTNNQGLVLINKRNGIARLVTNGTIPADHIRIGSYTTNLARTVTTIVDERAPYIPNVLSSGFALTVSGTNIAIASGVIAPDPFSVYDMTAEPLRVFKRVVFPTRGKYDIRIKRLTADAVTDKLQDVATWTALRSVTYINPVNKSNISGSALRIRATDQLSGTVDRYNCIVSSLVLFWDGSAWVEGVSSNPAAIFRHVLQSPAFTKALPDSRINLTKLQEWADYCDDKNLTYNRIIDYETSIDEVLKDIAAAGMATPNKVDGIYSVIIDNERPTIKGLVTPRNSWAYKGNINYPDVPHALRVQFRNSDKGYELDERIVYADGYDSTNATEFERIEFSSCTNSDLAWFYGRRYLATALLQPETHTFTMDFENLTFNRGDRIVFVNDAVLVGVGQARIKSLISSGANTIGFVVDETIEIPSTSDFGVRVRQSNGSGFDYYSLNTTVGETDTFMLRVPVAAAAGPQVDSLCAFTEFEKEVDLLVTDIRMNKDQSAVISAVNYAPERFVADSEPIPPFQSNITLTLGFFQPQPPLLGGEIKSDESVMIRNSDGSYTSRMLIPLINPNEPSVMPVVLVQLAGATQWRRAETINVSEELVGITGLQDGSVYNVSIRYQRQTGQMLVSAPLVLNNIPFIGASARPAQVQGFRMTTSGSTGLFEWLPNADIDLSHYVIRFTRATTGALWINSQVISDNIKTNRESLPVQTGTYLIKAVDFLGNESEDEAVVISFNTGAFNNVVETLTQHTAWAGVKTNVSVVSSALRLTNYALVGYYEFDPSEVDLGDIYDSILSASLTTSAFQSVGGLKVRTLGSVRDTPSIRGIDSGSWAVTLQMNLDGAGWVDFRAGSHVFEKIKFRLKLESFEASVTPVVSAAEVVIDMPDRIERGAGLTVLAAGRTITYPTPFKNNPAVNITLQDGATDDRIVFTSKTSSGFTIRIYNDTAAGYVDRVFDYASVGYGKVQ